MESATFWKRAGAFIIDLGLIFFLMVMPFAHTFIHYTKLVEEGIVPLKLTVVLLIISLLALTYMMCFEYYFRQTIGMMVFNIKAESDGQFTLVKSFLRNCFVLPYFPFYIFWMIDPIYLLIRKERLLEKLSGTRTISTRLTIQEYKLNKV